MEGKQTEALTCLKKAVSLDPLFHHAWYGLYQAYRQRGDEKAAEQARAHFEKARKLYDRIEALREKSRRAPDNVTLLLDLADALLQRGEAAEALSMVMRVLEREPADRRAQALKQRAADQLTRSRKAEGKN